ncbi:Hsp70 family protein, partial [bacterium]|nr:Hsp70 family protein [bacterium]
DIDANGILSVTAKDEATGKDQRVTITSSSGLNEKEIEQMVQDAEKYAAEDNARREAVENRNKADSLCHSVEKSIGELKDKVSADKLSDVENKVKTLREAIDRQDDAQIKERMEALEAAMRELATAAYAQAGGQPGAPAGGGREAAASSDDDVIDAEFEESN